MCERVMVGRRLPSHHTRARHETIVRGANRKAKNPDAEDRKSAKGRNERQLLTA